MVRHSKSFVELDPETWIVTHSVENSDSYLLDMAYDYAGKTMYGLMPDGNDVKLVTIDLENGSATPVGTLPNIVRTLACNIGLPAFTAWHSTTATLCHRQTHGFGTNSRADRCRQGGIPTVNGFRPQYRTLVLGGYFRIGKRGNIRNQPGKRHSHKLGNALFKGTDPSELVCLFTTL